MSIGIENILDLAISHAFRLGVFDRVNQHELKTSTGNGLTVSVWCQTADPIQALSSLTTTTIRLETTVRLYQNMNFEPQDEIDPNLIKAADLLMTAYSGDFDLEGTVRNVDLLGAHGPGLGFTAGYVELGGAMCRIVDIRLPLICQDVWLQGA